MTAQRIPGILYSLFFIGKVVFDLAAGDGQEALFLFRGDVQQGKDHVIAHVEFIQNIDICVVDVDLALTDGLPVVGVNGFGGHAFIPQINCDALAFLIVGILNLPVRTPVAVQIRVDHQGYIFNTKLVRLDRGHDDGGEGIDVLVGDRCEGKFDHVAVIKGNYRCKGISCLDFVDQRVVTVDPENAVTDGARVRNDFFDLW